MAHLTGAGRDAEARNVLRQALLAALACGFLLALAGAGLSGPLPRALGGAADVCPDASRYFLIYALALPASQRAAVHLHYYEGYTSEEIGAILGQRPGTVRSHLSRARDALRRYLSDEEGEG